MSEVSAFPGRLPVRGVVRFLGSLTFLIILLSAMLVALILPTVFNQFINPDYGYDRTVGALRRDWYGAWWFNILMGLLMVNLTVCTVIRTPWRYFWMWGFLITHSGILTLMIGAAVTFNTKIYGDLQAVEGGAYDYFTIEHENEIAVRTSSGERATFDIRANPYRRSADRKSFRLPESSTFIHIEEYVPNVVYDRTFQPAAGGRHIVAEIVLHFENGDSKRRYLVAGQDEHLNRLTLLALPVREEHFARLTAPTGEDGLLSLSIGGETREIDVAGNKDKPVRVGDAEVTVRAWGRPDKENGDYWVRFDVARAGRVPETWRILAFDFDHPLHRVGAPDPADPGFTGTFNPRLRPGEMHGAHAAGALYFCKVGSGYRFVAISSTGEKSTGPLEPGQKVRYPFMAIPLEVEFVRWLDAAEESAEPAEPRKNRPRVPALRVTVASGAHRDTQWVKYFTEGARFTVGEQTVDVIFRGRQYRELPFSLGLDDFRVAFNKGTMSARHFESDLTLTDLETGEVTKQTIEVNTPMKYKGFVIYQASWNPDDHSMSIFQISKDPGKKILYLGWVMAVSGSIFMFFLKPFLQKLIKAGSRGPDAPLGSGAALLLFGLVTLGTTAGVVAPLLFPGVDALWLGLGIAGADLVLALVVALIARGWRESKPVRALQTGEILAGGWCLNTAALVVLLMMKVTA